MVCGPLVLVLVGALLASSSSSPSSDINNNNHKNFTNHHPAEHSNNKNKKRIRKYEFHVAPMQGYTSAPLRYLFRLLSEDAILWTEMEKVRDLKKLANDDKALQKRFGSKTDNNNNNNLVLQLGGNHVQDMRECVASLVHNKDYYFREINLNCGCPSIETGGADFGASLMKDPGLTRQIIQAISEGLAKQQQRTTKTANTADTMISLKCRTAVYETVEEMMESYDITTTTTTKKKHKHREEQDFQSLCTYIDQARLGGISHVILHARPAVLAGLSPTNNRMVPPLDYEMVDRVAAAFPDLRVTLNGGIASLEDLHAQHLKLGQPVSNNGSSMVGSHMAGRWMLQHPLTLATIQNKFLNENHGGEDHNTHPNQYYCDAIFLSSVLDKYMQFVEESLANNIHTITELTLPLYLIVEDLRMSLDGDDDDDDLMDMDLLPLEEDFYLILKETVERLSSLIGPGGGASKKTKELPESVQWKRLASHLGNIVGKKVYNKWKRNRNEL